MKTETFLKHLEALGVANPTGWLDSRSHPSIWDIAGLAFLAEILAAIPKEGDVAWLERMSKYGIGPMDKLIAQGAHPEELLSFLRSHLRTFAWDVCTRISEARTEVKGLEQIRWGIWGEDNDGRPIHRLPELQDHITAFDSQ